jgi:hypothetical protein
MRNPGIVRWQPTRGGSLKGRATGGEHPTLQRFCLKTSHISLQLQAAFDGDVDVRTERAVCRLLLGDMDGAEAVLGLSAASDGSTGPDPGILAYIQVCRWAWLGAWPLMRLRALAVKLQSMQVFTMS